MSFLPNSRFMNELRGDLANIACTLTPAHR